MVFTLLRLGIALELRLCLTWRKVLFIVASEIIKSNFIEFDATFGHNLYIFYDDLVVGVLLIVLEALGTHITGDRANSHIQRLLILLVTQGSERVGNIFAIMLEGDTLLIVVSLTGVHHQALACRTLIRRVHI